MNTLKRSATNLLFLAGNTYGTTLVTLVMYQHVETTILNDVYLPFYASPCMHGKLRMVRSSPCSIL
jgi:hypothetical protein